MFRTNGQGLVWVTLVCGATAAHADYVGSLGSISAPASVPFSNSTDGNLTVAPLLPPASFADTWTFTLIGSANIVALSAGFSAGTYGVSNLQVNLLDGSNTVVANGVQTTTPNGPFIQSFSFTPSAAFVSGLYQVQVLGTLDGAPAAYTGSLIASAPSTVPLPAALPLLLLGLGALGATGLRKRHPDRAA